MRLKIIPGIDCQLFVRFSDAAENNHLVDRHLFVLITGSVQLCRSSEQHPVRPGRGASREYHSGWQGHQTGWPLPGDLSEPNESGPELCSRIHAGKIKLFYFQYRKGSLLRADHWTNTVYCIVFYCPIVNVLWTERSTAVIENLMVVCSITY